MDPQDKLCFLYVQKIWGGHSENKLLVHLQNKMYAFSSQLIQVFSQFSSVLSVENWSGIYQ